MNIELLKQGVAGSGGGSSSSSKGSGGGSTKESSNTLRSDNRIKLLELISEGPCVGLANSGTSIYLDKTPVVNDNGSVNFRGVQWDVRNGFPDQPAIPGNPQVETPFSVGVKVFQATGPVLRTIVDENTTSVRVVVEVQALANTDSNGNIGTNSVQWQVQVRAAHGGWEVADQVDLLNQKCTSPYQQASMVYLPTGGAPWDIQVVRLTPDSNTLENQNDISWVSYSEIIAGNFTYPNSAMVYLDVDAALFDSSSIPTRYFDWKGLIIQIPSNYDPETRAYTGIWDGTFNYGWTSNPAWVFYDLVTNDRYGLGEFIDASKVDKWSLYQIAQYCDQNVPDGYGGVEARYAFNACINNRDEAYRVLQSITTAWRGMAFWSLGQVFATIDAPRDPVKLVAPGNVIGGHFNYSGTGLKARHTVALVSWNDPNDFYQPAIEVVINNEMLQKYGWRETSIQAIGCTSRSLAHRYGKWLLDTEQYETETVEYQASWDHATVKPGDLIAIADPNKAGTRIGGRITAIDGNAQVITLDQEFAPLDGSTYSFLIAGPLGKIQTRGIVEFRPGAEVVVDRPLNPAPSAGAMWIISGTDVNKRLYSVLSIKEDDKHLFTISALFHDPNKYARVEQGIYFDPIPYTRPRTTIDAPKNFSITESLYEQNGSWASRLLLSWTAGSDFQSSRFHISADTPQGFVDFGDVVGTSYNLDNVVPGEYTFYLYAMGFSGQISTPVQQSFTATGWARGSGPYITGLEIKGQGANTTFGGRDVTIDWVNNFPGSGVDIAQDKIAGAGTKNPFYRDNIVTVYNADTGNVLRTDIVLTDTYTYTYMMNAADNAAWGDEAHRELKFQVILRNTLGQQSIPVKLTVNNPVPDMIIPNVLGGIDSVFVSYFTNSDIDFMGALIWMSENQNFDPISTPPTYDGPNNFVSLPAGNLKTYYVRLGAYDAFGKTGLNISPPIQVFTGDRIFDKDPPSVPTGLVLVTQIVTLPTGEIQTALIATWDKNPSDNFSYDTIEIKKTSDDDTHWIASTTNKTTYQWIGVEPTISYDVRLRALSVAGYPSNYAETATLVIPKKTTPPGAPTALSVLTSIRSFFLSWTNPVDSDLADIEIWAGPSSDFTAATIVGKSYTNAFTVSAVATGQTLFFWIRAMNTSELVSGFTGPVSAKAAPVAHLDIGEAVVSGNQIMAATILGNNIAGETITGNLIAAGTITADLIRAGTITGDQINVSTYLPATITIGKNGITMGATTDPATLINANTTTVGAGKILIAGNTRLSDWRNGSDTTKIEGGSIAANTITANKLTIGQRGLTVSGLQFGYNKTANNVNWTAGAISYTDAAGASQTVAITAGNFHYDPAVAGAGAYPCAYVAWQEGATTLSASMVQANVTGGNFVQMAVYRGFTDLIATYGRTVIDGSNIVTGSITANQLVIGELITNVAQINAGIISNVHLAGNITFDKMGGGTLSVADAIRIGGDHFRLLSLAQLMEVRDGQGFNDGSGVTGRVRLQIGKIGGGATDYGINAFDPSGNLMFSTGAPISVSNITGLGAFAYSNRITAGNAGTFIAAAAIQSAMIGQIDTGLITTSGMIDVQDQNTGRLRVRMGSIPGEGDYGLKIWDYNGNLVLSSTGLNGTFINDLTVGNGKISNNAISTMVSAYIGGTAGSISVSFTLDVAANVLIHFTNMNILRDGGSASVYMYLDGNQIQSGALAYASQVATTAGVAMALQRVSAGTHTVEIGLASSSGSYSNSLSLTVTALKK